MVVCVYVCMTVWVARWVGGRSAREREGKRDEEEGKEKERGVLV